MALRTIPLSPTPNQSFSLVLAERNVSIALRTLAEQLYIDVMCESVPICSTRICQDRQVLTGRAEHLGFPGLRLCFADLRGTSDPHWAELGTRYLLLSVELDAAAEARMRAQIIESHSALTYDGSAMFDGSEFFDGSD